MDENKDENLENITEEAIIESPKKSNKTMMVLIAVAVVLAIAIAAVLITGMKKPEQVVREAFSATGVELDKQNALIMEEIPFYKMMLPQTQEAGQGSFKLSIDSYDDGTGNAETAMIANILKLFELSGETFYDPTINRTDIKGSVNMSGNALVDLFLSGSADTIAFNVPKFSDKVLSINPQTFVEDYKKSPFYSPDMDEASLKELQDAITTEFGAMSKLGSIDSKKLQSEMYAILNGVFTNAVYDKPIKDGATKNYTVKLDGEQVKNTLVNLVKYIYIDSDIGKIYPDSMKDILQKEIIAPIETLAPMPATMVVKIDKSGLLSQIDFTSDIAQTDGNVKFNNLKASYVFADKMATQDLNMTMGMTVEEKTADMVMNVKNTYKDGVNNASMKMTMGGAAMDGESMAMDAKMSFDKAGLCDINMNMGSESPESVMPMINLAIKGNLTAENGVNKFDFPTLKLTVGAGDTKISVGLKAGGESKKLEQPMQPLAATIPFFAMSEDELNAEMQKYSDGVNGVIEQLFGVLFGGGNIAEEEVPAA